PLTETPVRAAPARRGVPRGHEPGTPRGCRDAPAPVSIRDHLRAAAAAGRGTRAAGMRLAAEKTHRGARGPRAGDDGAGEGGVAAEQTAAQGRVPGLVLAAHLLRAFKGVQHHRAGQVDALTDVLTGDVLRLSGGQPGQAGAEGLRLAASLLVVGAGEEITLDPVGQGAPAPVRHRSALAASHRGSPLWRSVGTASRLPTFSA